MVYKKAKEKQKWSIWKNKEEQYMREQGMDEEIIKQLHAFDEESFNAERRILQRQIPVSSFLFDTIADYTTKDINSISAMLDEIENEKLLYTLQQEDAVTLLVLLLKMMGYSVQEVSQMLHLKEKTIYSRIGRLRKKLNKF